MTAPVAPAPRPGFTLTAEDRRAWPFMSPAARSLLAEARMAEEPTDVGAPGDVRGGLSHEPGGWCE